MSRPGLALALLLVAGAARAEGVHRLALAGGGDVSLLPARYGHGFGLLRYELTGLPRGGRFLLELNTDTLRVGVDGLRPGRAPIELGVLAAGEAFIAGLLPNYLRDGVDDPRRGFYASWAALAGWVRYAGRHHFADFTATGRYWFFNRTGDTDPALVLPPEGLVGELRLHYTYWNLAPDRSLWEGGRSFQRVDGAAVGLEAGVDLRQHAAPWGARDPAAFAPVDPRNDPWPAIPSLRLRVWLGKQVAPVLRFQLQAHAAWMWGEDDLVRARLGGLNPYVVPIAGAPWAGWLSGRFVAAEGSMHLRVWRELEVGALLDVAILDDASRTGAGGPSALFGLGAFGDLRFGAWQLDLRAGWSPLVRPGAQAVSLFAAVGWSWEKPRR